jgi:hypothetical protein
MKHQNGHNGVSVKAGAVQSKGGGVMGSLANLTGANNYFEIGFGTGLDDVETARWQRQQREMGINGSGFEGE